VLLRLEILIAMGPLHQKERRGIEEDQSEEEGELNCK